MRSISTLSLCSSLILSSCGQKPTEKKPTPKPPAATTQAVTPPKSVPAPTSAPVASNQSAPTLEAKKLDGPYPDDAKHCDAMKAQSKLPQGECKSGEDFNLFSSENYKITKEPYDAQVIEVISEDNPTGLFLRVNVKEQRHSFYIDELQPMMMAADGGMMTSIKGLELKVEDMITGGSPELIFTYQKELIERGGDNERLATVISYLLLCGLGASGVPSCAEPFATSAKYFSGDKEAEASSWEFKVAMSYNALEVSAPVLNLKDVQGLTMYDQDPSDGDDEKLPPGAKSKEDISMKTAREKMEKRVGRWSVVFP